MTASPTTAAAFVGLYAPENKSELVAYVQKKCLTSTPAHVTLVLDASGSMSAHIPAMAAAVSSWVGTAPEGLSVAIVAFGDSAKTVWSCEELNSAAREDCAKMISYDLKTMGQTNIQAALSAAQALVKTDKRNGVVLLTDGMPNLGSTCPKFLAAMTAGHDVTASVMFTASSSHALSEEMKRVNERSRAYFSSDIKELAATMKECLEDLDLEPQGYELLVGEESYPLDSSALSVGVPLLLKERPLDASVLLRRNEDEVHLQSTVTELLAADRRPPELENAPPEAHDLWKKNCAAVARAMEKCRSATDQVIDAPVETGKDHPDAKDKVEETFELIDSLSLDCKEEPTYRSIGLEVHVGRVRRQCERLAPIVGAQRDLAL